MSAGGTAAPHDVIVLGGGAAGLFCAALAGQRGRHVVVLERNQEPGRKILISGGGRCNFTNLHCRPDHFLSGNPAFVRSALARYTPADFVDLVERHQIAYHEKAHGQLFCDGSARQVVALLLDECARGHVEVVMASDVAEVRHDGQFVVETAQQRYAAPALVVACGGLSIPKMGATDFGYRIAAQFAVPIVAPRPALVPFIFADGDRRAWCDLSGVAADTIVTAGGVSFPERMLITHRGLSGPAVLQASSYWSPGEALDIDLLPDVDLVAELTGRRAAGDRATTRAALASHLPDRLAERWFAIAPPSSVIASTSNERIASLSDQLHHWRVVPAGTEGFEKAEVTAGGVDTAALSSKTMAVREVPGLFFIGEVVDVTGHLGGFNFQWAWASAHACAAAL